MALKKNKAMKKSKKGILLTLLTIVLFVLMLGELITYVVLNINYTNIASQASQSLNSGSFVSNLNGSISNFMHTSLNNALYSAIYYEGNPTLRKDYFINNTSFVLSTLMQNGTINGYNMSSRMGETMSKYIASLKNSASAQNIALNITNGSLSIYQNSAFAISASYTALASINQSGSVSTYPIYAHTSVSVAYKPDLLSVEEGMNTTLIPYSGYPKAQLIGNIYAKAGSISPFMFVYGTPSYVSGEPKCSGISSSVENANYILVTPDAADINQSVCNMGGLITNITNTTTPLKPYLLYTNATVINDTRNYTHVLLNGPGLAAYSLSTLKNAITNGYYFATNYTPDYLGQAQGSVNQVSNYGLASFNLLNRNVANLSINNGYIAIPSIPHISGSSTATISAWVYLNSLGNNQIILSDDWGSPEVLQMYVHTNGQLEADFGSGSGWIVAALTNAGVIKTNKWYYVIAKWSSGSGESIYINGVQQQISYIVGSNTATGILGTPGTGDIGSNQGNGGTLIGSISNLQVYNSSLSSFDINKIYGSGLSAMPISNAGLVGWYPLNGNANDYSGNGNNGVPTNVIYSGLSNYTLDALPDAPITTFNSGKAHFNGYSSYITGNSYAFPITATAWVYPTNLQSPHLKVIMELDGNQPSSSGQGESYQFFIVPKGSGYCGGIAGTLFLWNNSAATCTNLIVPLNKWSFVAFTINTSAMKVFLNGQIYIYPATLTSANPSNKIFLVGEQGDNRYFNGSIRNIQIYNASFNESELKSLYKGGMNSGPINNTNLAGWWPLDGNANDYSGYNNNGTPIAVSFNALPNDPTSNLVEGIFNCTSMNQCSSSMIQHLYLNPLPLAYAGKGFMNETTALGLPYGGISDVASFNGQSGYIGAPVGTWLGTNHNFTVVAWYYSLGGGGSIVNICTSLSCGGWSTPFLGYNSNGSTYAWINGPPVLWNSTPFGKWYFAAITYSATSNNEFLYVNGKTVSEGTGTYSPSGTFDYATIGADPTGQHYGQIYFDGSIADAQIYNVALSSAQIQELYLNNTVSGATPVAYWPLSTGLNGLLNQTPDVINGNTGYLYSGSSQCTVAEVADGTCGVEYAQP